MSIVRRIVSGTVANSAGIAMNAILQVVTVPVLASAWGVENFGLWMMLTTIPAYFALTDLGFLQAATSEITMQVAVGQQKDAVRTFQSSTVLIFGICVLALVLMIGAAFGAELFGYLDASVSIGLVLTLSVFAALGLLSRLPLAALRATGHYAIGTLAYDSMCLIEGLASLLTAYLGGGFLDVALCLVAFRLVNMAFLYLFLKRKVPWMGYGFDEASVGEIRRLAKPALAALTIPLALAINLQGVVLIIGAVLSPAAVAIYTPVRTCSRLLIQVIGVVNRATMPELAKAQAVADERELSRIFKINGLVILVFLLPGSLVFAGIGKEFVEIWSGGHISPERELVILMAVATLVHGTWYFTSNLLLATNTHVELAKYSLAAAAATLALVFGLSLQYGLIGVGFGLIIGELLSAIATAWIFISKYRRKPGAIQ